MHEFVEECRREWHRLGVPDPIANEMAADLAADIEEAESEGGSAEDVLGNSGRSTPGVSLDHGQSLEASPRHQFPLHRHAAGRYSSSV